MQVETEDCPATTDDRVNENQQLPLAVVTKVVLEEVSEVVLEVDTAGEVEHLGRRLE